MSQRTLTWLVFFVLLSALALHIQNLIVGRDSESLFREQDVYQRLRGIIRERYVTEIDEAKSKKMFFGAMHGMTSSLDPHSQFFSPDEYEPFKIKTTGQLEGVGIEIDHSDTLGVFVLTPLQGTPAWKGGVLPGDRILKIDGKPTKDMSQDEARNLIKGEPGTKVTLTLLHEGAPQPVNITLTRDVIDIKSVPQAEILGPPWVSAGGPKIGYIQVVAFMEKTAADLDSALHQLEEQKMQALILDLRENPGGLLKSAVETASLFLKDGPIVKVLGRNAGQEQDYESHGEKTHPPYPMVILIDSSSASASEIVAGALQDRGRAVLAGDRSYGKFSVQEVIQVPLAQWGEAALKLTTAKYKTPKGPCVDTQGLKPDYEVPSDTHGLIMDRLQRHLQDNNPSSSKPTQNVYDLFPEERENTAEGAAHPAGKEKPPEPFFDRQLQKAVEVLLLKLQGAKAN